MKLTWKDVQPHFKDVIVWVDEYDLYWYRNMWNLLELNGLTIYYSTVEKLAVYSRIYALIKIYKGFCNRAFGEIEEFDLYFDNLSDESELISVYESLIQDDDAVIMVFDVLKEKLGIDKTFCSMWMTCRPDDLDLDEISTFEHYSDALNSILNFNISTDKLAAYEWLSNYM